MFDKKSEISEPEAPLDTLPPLPAKSKKEPFTMIGASSKIKGELTGEEDLVIQGKVEGTIQLQDNSVSIGEQGHVQANVFAKNITVEGELSGDMHGTEKVMVTRSGKVKGNILAPRVVLEDGASFKGSIDMDTKLAAPAKIHSTSNNQTKTKTA